MASLIIKLVYILIGLSIAEDFLHFGGFSFNAEQYGTEISAQSSGLFLPGANGAPVAPLVPLVRFGAAQVAKAIIKEVIKQIKEDNEDAGM